MLFDAILFTELLKILHRCDYHTSINWKINLIYLPNFYICDLQQWKLPKYDVFVKNYPPYWNRIILILHITS